MKQFFNPRLSKFKQIFLNQNNSKKMANHELIKQGVLSEEKLAALGFTKETDNSDDPRGEEWFIENDRFRLSVDCWLDVKLQRKDADAEFIYPIILKVENIHDLSEAIDFIK